MLQTTHHPARTDVYTRRVSLSCGEGSSVTRTVRIYVYHPEHVRAVEIQRAPVTRSRPETAPLAAALGVGKRRPLPGPARSPAHAPAAQGGADAGGRFQLVELVAVVGRVAKTLLASGAALASVAAAAPDEKARMLAAFDVVLTGMAYAGVGLCFFAIVWAGFVLMAEGAEGEGSGRGKARNAVIMAVVGLVVVLLAKGIAAALNSRIIEVLPGP